MTDLQHKEYDVLPSFAKIRYFLNLFHKSVSSLLANKMVVQKIKLLARNDAGRRNLETDSIWSAIQASPLHMPFLGG